MENLHATCSLVFLGLLLLNAKDCYQQNDDVIKWNIYNNEGISQAISLDAVSIRPIVIVTSFNRRYNNYYFNKQQLKVHNYRSRSIIRDCNID